MSGEEEKLLLIANPHRADEFIVGKFRKSQISWAVWNHMRSSPVVWPIQSDGTEGWNDVSEEDKIAMNYYEKHQVHLI